MQKAARRVMEEAQPSSVAKIRMLGYAARCKAALGSSQVL